MRIIIGLLSFILTTFAFATESFSIKTNAFLNNSAMPTLYTCDGKDISPELSWNNAPSKARAFALIMSDPDAPNGTWYHWVIYNIPANTKQLAENSSLPAGTLTGKNSWGKAQYNGPCPPKGSAHKYIFTLYALDTLLNLKANEDTQTVLSQVKNHTIQSTDITAIYNRWAG